MQSLEITWKMMNPFIEFLKKYFQELFALKIFKYVVVLNDILIRYCLNKNTLFHRAGDFSELCLH